MEKNHNAVVDSEFHRGALTPGGRRYPTICCRHCHAMEHYQESRLILDLQEFCADEDKTKRPELKKKIE